MNIHMYIFVSDNLKCFIIVHGYVCVCDGHVLYSVEWLYRWTTNCHHSLNIILTLVLLFTMTCSISELEFCLSSAIFFKVGESASFINSFINAH